MAIARTLHWAIAPAVLAAAALSPAHGQQGAACARLEAQLAAFDRSASDPARNEQTRRYEEAANSQQNEIDRQEAAARRLGCENNNFFVLFSGQPAQCGPINAKIRQMRSNLERIHSDLARLQQGGAGPERDGQRRAILVALSQNNCGQQYRTAVTASQPRGGLFESLFGPGSVFNPSGNSGWFSGGGTFRTICVRTCDGYFYPISFATSPDHFDDDARACQNSCPAAEVMLFSHRNPGEDVSQAVSTSGQLYSTLPNAFRYRQAFDPSCSCRRPGETWAQALKHLEDSTVEQGDIVVNEERARAMARPRVDAQGKPIKPALRAGAKPEQRPAEPPANQEADAAPKAKAVAVKPDPNRKVRSVGPTFIPAR